MRTTVCFLVYRGLSSLRVLTWWKGRGGTSFIKVLIQHTRTSPSGPDHLPKTPPPNTITLEMLSTEEFGGNTNMQCLSGSLIKWSTGNILYAQFNGPYSLQFPQSGSLHLQRILTTLATAGRLSGTPSLLFIIKVKVAVFCVLGLREFCSGHLLISCILPEQMNFRPRGYTQLDSLSPLFRSSLCTSNPKMS